MRYQLHEATDRINLLNDELTEVHHSDTVTSHAAEIPTAEVTRLLSATEAKYEARIADLRRQLTAAERERDDVETDLSRRLSEKVEEIDELKAIAERFSKSSRAALCEPSKSIGCLSAVRYTTSPGFNINKTLIKEETSCVPYLCSSR